MAQLSNTTIYGNLKVSGNNSLQGNLFANDIAIMDSDSSHYLFLSAGSDLTADRILTLTTGDASRTINLGGDITTAGALTTAGAFSLTFTTTAITNAILPSGTITLMDLETAQTVSGVKTFNNSTICLKGSSTGYTIFTSANTGATNYTLTLPAGSTTMVGTTTTQILTNKTLTAPKISSASYIADTNGNELIAFPATVASAVNELTVSNAATTLSPTISATGGDTNIGINLVTKGTGSVNVTGGLVVSGDLTVQGTLVYIDVEDLRVEDNNIQLGYVTTPTDVTANGGGITLKGGATDKTIIWDNTYANWTSSEHWNLASGKEYKINNVSVLNATTLGSSVVSSSLTSVGTISTGTWSATTIAVNKGGTGLTSYAIGDILYASGTTTIAKLADVATGNVVISGGVGVAPSYGKVGLTTHITGTLAVGNGGTGATTLTSTGILVGNGTSAISAPGPTLTSTTMTFGGAGTINSTSTNALTLDSGTTGAINIGNNANAKTITIGNATGATGVVVNSGTGGVTFNQVASGIFKIQASAAPTTDMVQITNAGKPTVTAGVNGLNVTYVGGAAAVEASAIRADITPGTTSGGIWNTFKVVSTAAAASGVTMNVFKIDNKTTGAGTSNILYAGTGYDNIINYNGTTVINGTGNVIAGQLSGTIPSAVLGNSTIYIGTTGIALNRASATLSLTSIKLGSLTTNGPIYTSGSDGTLNSETYLDVTRGGTGVGSFTAGQILYGAGTADIATSTNLFWDSTNNRLGIYEGTPAERLHINGDFRIDDSLGNAGFKMSYNDISKTLDFAWVGA